MRSTNMFNRMLCKIGVLVLAFTFSTLFINACHRGQSESGSSSSTGEAKAAEQVKGVPSKAVGKPGGVTEDTATAGNRIAMIIAFEDFQDKEFAVPKEILEKAGLIIDVFSSKKGEASSIGELKVDIELTLEDLLSKVNDYAAIIFVGGPGSVDFHKNKTAHDIILAAQKSGKVLAAICLGPFTLANAGILKGVEATAWTDDEVFTVKGFEKLGARYVKKPVVVSGRIVTANGPSASAEFGAAIVELLKK